jgi:hypothetical protein
MDISNGKQSRFNLFTRIMSMNDKSIHRRLLMIMCSTTLWMCPLSHKSHQQTTLTNPCTFVDWWPTWEPLLCHQERRLLRKTIILLDKLP